MHFWAPMYFWASLIFDIVMLNKTLSLTWASNLEFVKDKRFLKEFHVLLFLMIEDFFCDTGQGRNFMIMSFHNIKKTFHLQRKQNYISTVHILSLHFFHK